MGLARYLQVVIERRSGIMVVVLVANTTSAQLLAPCLELIRELAWEHGCTACG